MMCRLALLLGLLLLGNQWVLGLEFPLPAEGYRTTKDISSGWLFRADPRDQGAGQSWWNAETDRSGWVSIDIPAVWDKRPGSIVPPIRRQVGWYARQIAIPEDWTGTVHLHFLGSQYMTDVWVDGEWIGSHLGGYSPFAFPVSARAGDQVEVVVRVDNRLSNETIPTSHMGWQPFGGLTREVFLAERPQVFMEDFRWTCRLDTNGAAVLRIQARQVGSDVVVPTEASVYAGDQLVAEVAQTSADLDMSLTVASPRLWSPDDPYLHRVVLRWGEDQLALLVGLREIRIEGDQFLLNGEDLWLQGFGVHEEWSKSGPIVPHDARREELLLLKQQYGMNTIRPGHYPNHPELYRLCDELGILVFTEIPVWQIDLAFLHSDFGWQDWLEPQLEAMVDQYGAFTSVVSWGIGNENRSGAAANSYHRRAIEWMRARDPSRIPILVLAADMTLQVYDFLDLGARNFHYGWYHSDSVYEVRRGFAANKAAAKGKPIWVAEHGAHAAPGRYNGAYNDLSRGSEIYQDQVVRYGFQYLATQDGVIGMSPWSWADFYRQNRYKAHGVTDVDRRPKLACSSLRELMGGGPVRLFAREKTSAVSPGTEMQCGLHIFQPRPPAESEAGWRGRWTVRRGMDIKHRGEFTCARPAQRQERVELVKWQTATTDRGHHSLWFELIDPQGQVVYVNVMHFGIGVPEQPGVLSIPPLGEDAWLVWDELRIPIREHPGLIIPLAPMPHQFTIERAGQRADLTVTMQSGQALVVDPTTLTWMP